MKSLRFDNKFWFVYQITHKVTGHFYIGIASTKKASWKDHLGKTYFTSGCLAWDFMQNKSHYKQECLYQSYYHGEVQQREREWIYLHFENPLNLNMHYDKNLIGSRPSRHKHPLAREAYAAMKKLNE